MTTEEELVNRILHAGSTGIKKTDLRKEFRDIDAVLETVISKGQIFVDKRGNAYYCFHKDHYIQSLLNSDPRFKLTYDMIKSLNESISSSNRELTSTIEILTNNISNIARIVLEIKNGDQLLLQQHALSHDVSVDAEKKSTMSVHDFKGEFDVALSNSCSSIGWTELAKIRNELCKRCNISTEEFYRLVDELTSMNQDRYELSTGGVEGVMVRGLLHGFVRCI
ncbi:MAG: hypothetical protein M3258_08975 [Thermoproteota archaeon]|jgi:hypothetical protein|nr:hypothetical protein [Thermoproteota archaeon]